MANRLADKEQVQSVKEIEVYIWKVHIVSYKHTIAEIKLSSGQINVLQLQRSLHKTQLKIKADRKFDNIWSTGHLTGTKFILLFSVQIYLSYRNWWKEGIMGSKGSTDLVKIVEGGCRGGTGSRMGKLPQM